MLRKIDKKEQQAAIEAVQLALSLLKAQLKPQAFKIGTRKWKALYNSIKMLSLAFPEKLTLAKIAKRFMSHA